MGAPDGRPLRGETTRVVIAVVVVIGARKRWYRCICGLFGQIQGRVRNHVGTATTVRRSSRPPCWP